jgi:PAS domain-containing protein
LAALRGDTHLVEAVIYDVNGKLFAHYESALAEGKSPPPLRPPPFGARFENGAVVVCDAILFKKQQVGTIYLTSTADEMDARLRRYIGIVCMVLLVSMGLGLLSGARVQRLIGDPITELSGVARRVALEKNYSVRAAKHADDEIGILTDSFNEMLSQIEIHLLPRRSAEESLRESEERYALAARGANDGLWDWKLSTNKVYFSHRWNEMLAYPITEGWSDPEDWFSRIHPLDHDRVKSEIAAHLAGTTSEFASSLWF